VTKEELKEATHFLYLQDNSDNEEAEEKTVQKLSDKK
jgi:hypothetical protein